MPARLLAVFAVIVLGGLLGAQPTAPSGTESETRLGVTDTANEYRVKAAFLYNFIRYTTWPAESFKDESAPLIVAVVGKNPFGKHLEKTFAGKQVGGRAIVLRNVKEVKDTLDAHVVFDGGVSTKGREELLRQCRQRPLLLVGERDGFATAGAQCNLYISKGRVRFEINVDAVRVAKLEISSQLLKLARIVRDKKAAR